MKNRWIRISGLAVGLALMGALAFSVTAFAYGPGPGGSGRAVVPGSGLGVGGAWSGPQNSLVAVAAETLGMEQADLIIRLQDGETIADVAGEQLDEIVDAYLAPRAEAIAASVASGRLTQAQADLMLETMTAQITERLSSPFSPSGYGLYGGTQMGMGFVDADGDGVCDYLGSASGRSFAGGTQMGMGFVDADGDGVCDYLGSAAGGRGGMRGGSRGR